MGREADTTLIDFVSHRWAPSPAAAAEMAILARANLLADLARKAAQPADALASATRERRLRPVRAERGLLDLPLLLGTARQRLDDRVDQLGIAPPRSLGRWRTDGCQI